MNLDSTTVEGKVVKVGDSVGFKCDIEQGGKITKITRTAHGVMLTLTSKYGFHGEYIGGQTVTQQAAQDCWVD